MPGARWAAIWNSFTGSAGAWPFQPSLHLKPICAWGSIWNGWHSISSSHVLPERGEPQIQRSFDSSSASSNGRPAVGEYEEDASGVTARIRAQPADPP